MSTVARRINDLKYTGWEVVLENGEKTLFLAAYDDPAKVMTCILETRTCVEVVPEGFTIQSVTAGDRSVVESSRYCAGHYQFVLKRKNP